MDTTLSKFIKVKNELYQTKFTKSKSVGKMYNYYELSDFLPSIIKLLSDNNLCHYFYFKNNDTCSRGVIRIIDINKQDDYLEIESILCNMTNIKDPKDVGAMSTYLKRYTYLVAFDITEDCRMEQSIGLKAEKDTATLEQINKILRQAGQPLRTEAQIKEYARQNNQNMEWVLDGIAKKYKKK